MQKDKACIYTRFSVYLDDLTDERLNEQITACVKDIESRGFEVDKVYVDLGISGNVLLRPNLIRLLNHIQNNKVSYLYVPNFTALSRDVSDYVKICEFLETNGVQLVTR